MTIPTGPTDWKRRFAFALALMLGLLAPVRGEPSDTDARTAELQDLRFGMFICWSFSTFSGYEWSPGVEDISFFHPTGFDPEQWCRVAKDAGMNYILFLTKHHDGFCLWDTRTTDRKVTNAPLGVDVLAEVKQACDRHGLKLALYFSEGDWSWSGRKDIHTSVAQPEIKEAQLRELLTNYGPIEYVWFDHAIGDGGISHADTAALVKSIQPECFVGFNNGEQDGADLRIGERGAPAPLTRVDAATIGSQARADHMKGHHGYKLAEFTYPILEGQGRQKQRGAQWFYSLPENDDLSCTPEKIFQDYLGAVKYGNLFALDVGPDRSGKIRRIDVETLKKVGEYVRGERTPIIPVSEERVQALKDLRWGMFICWSFSTFSGKEWTPGVKDVAFFKATDVDTDQWARTAKEAGMGYILFLAKHHDGFCLWDTDTTDRKVTEAPLGRDVLAELRTSCDRYGIRLAIYFSEGDWTWPGAVDGKGARSGGGSDPAMKKAQLNELLTRYGPIEYIWFDHAVGTGGLSHEDTIAYVKGLQPDCLVGFNHGDQAGADIRLGEMGRPGPLHDPAAAGPHMRDKPSKAYRLAEFTYPILPPHQGGAKWFYSLPKHDGLVHPPAKLYRDYLGAIQYENIFSIDVGPDYDGRLREIDVQTLRTVGRWIRGEERPPDLPLSLGKPARASSVWQGDSAYSPGKAFDGIPATRWGAAEDARDGWIEVDLGEPMSVSKAMIDEGPWDRVRKYEFLCLAGDDWKKLAAGERIGPSKTITFPTVTARVFRLSVIEAVEVPTILEIELTP